MDGASFVRREEVERGTAIIAIAAMRDTEATRQLAPPWAHAHLPIENEAKHQANAPAISNDVW